MKKSIIFYLLLLQITFSTFAQQYQPTWESVDKRPVPQWFADAKFGIFIHFGVYSVPSYRDKGYAEWYQVDVMGKPAPNDHTRLWGDTFQYRSFAPLFKAELFDANQWADIINKAGAKYVMLTSKHHDGFCLWQSSSKYSKGWNSVEVGPKRDIIAELAPAIRNKGIKFGLYYSLMEWETPLPSRQWISKSVTDKYKIPASEYIEGHMIPQMKELVTKYQPSLIWADGEWTEDFDYWKGPEFLSWLYNNAPNKDEVVVNDRWGEARSLHGGYYTREYGDNENVDAQHPWEECQGMGTSFGYNRNENSADYKSAESLLHLLIRTVSHGGNLLLNIGPAADGKIPVVMEERLAEMGDWLKINGEAIYGTKARNVGKKEKLAAVETDREGKGNLTDKAKVKEQEKTVFYTTKGSTLYAIFTKFPEGAITLEGVQTTANSKISMIGLEQMIPSKMVQNNLVLNMPVVPVSKAPCKYAYVIKIENAKF